MWRFIAACDCYLIDCRFFNGGRQQVGGVFTRYRDKEELLLILPGEHRRILRIELESHGEWPMKLYLFAFLLFLGGAIFLLSFYRRQADQIERRQVL